MTYLAIGLVVGWGCGLLFLVARVLNFLRLIYNNILPGKTDRGSLGFFPSVFIRTPTSGIDPASLNEAGRHYLEKARRNDWIMLAWGLCGFALLPWALSCFMAS